MTRGSHDERGATVIITALAMAAMIMMIAIVIDLGAARAERRDARATADAAATAASLDLATGSAAACATAFGYAFTNLGGTQPTASSIESACTAGGMVPTASCTSGATPARAATLIVGGTTVTVTNPVPDTSTLMRATAVGGGVGQAANPTPDGDGCDRIGVEITQTQPRFFGGVGSTKSPTFRVHSVARYHQAIRGDDRRPALIALNQHACKAIDTGSGNIWVERTPVGPGVVYSDSDGTNPACSSSDGILHTSGSGSIRAAASSPSAPGELAWYAAPASRGYASSQSVLENGTTSDKKHYVGRLQARDTRVTRSPADAVYHCSRPPSTCTSPDPVEEADSLARATTAPQGFTTWGGACTTAGASPTFAGKLFVSCPKFEVKDNPLVVTGGATVIFAGRLEVAAGGAVAVNVSSPSAPVVDETGLPVAVAPEPTQLIVGSTAENAIDMNSNSAAVHLAETFIYNRGGFRLQALSKLLWSPPASGPTKSLLYWSESSHALAIQGSPAFEAAGVMFQGNGPLTGGGGGTIDLTRVQMWVDKVILSGSTTVKLSPDPGNSITLRGPGSSLIR